MYNNQSAIRNPHSAINPLKALCNRMGISVPTQNPVAEDVIPIVQKRLAEHMRSEAQLGCDTSGDYIQWKQIKEALEEFLADLQILANPITPPRSVSGSEPDNLEPDNLITNLGPKADQNRTKTGPPSENPSKSAENSDEEPDESGPPKKPEPTTPSLARKSAK